MKTIKTTCHACESQFSITYDTEVVEQDPLHCPFCGEYLLEHEEVDDVDF
jgi:predicted  nucleic acid-binding Zn-ribbon protein